ncbi:hypothetical protein DACRYDRAFT_113367 [Dacryopinax primogenitus]|uniref:N-acetyltransferase domain-containing protein n=1 Tax=Dacryopinax primogenitus (strain DJM 731) TaxID=1858805 RepID=M5GA38_DACPD|nr:uncharacterized protein DACRYDRAFT_113367 [Dacryopinax primogenitus]EJU05180.1 hypothetical protein DACRYDRAFT_113367 [Dacryopinax primogenitus]
MSRPTYPVRHLSNPTPEQTEESIRLSMDAFRGDSFLRTTLGGQEADENLFYRFMRAHVVGAVVDGQLWVAEDLASEEPKIVGVALWFPPGTEFLGTEEGRKEAGMDKVIGSLSESMQRWWYDYFIPGGAKQANTYLGPSAKHDAYHMLMLAVLPSYHSKGIGRTLLFAQARGAFEQGKRVCWEASNEVNVEKYGRWGGRPRGKERYDGDSGEGGGERGFDMWTMELPKPETGLL